MTRLRSAAQRAPQTLEQAAALLARYAAADAAIAAIEADRAERLALANAAADEALVPLVAELKDLAKQLKPWWEGNVEELTAGKRKSIELGGCQVGYRVTPPKVCFAGGTDAAAVAVLIDTDFAERLVRSKTTTSLDKPAILKALEGEDAEALRALGFAAQQREEFFVDRVAPSTAATLVDAAAAATA